VEELDGRGLLDISVLSDCEGQESGISDDAPVRGAERIVISRTRGMLMQVQLCGYGGNLGFGRRRPKGMLLKIKGDPQRTLWGWDREDCDVVMTVEV
jgi:hypothetical protein